MAISRSCPESLSSLAFVVSYVFNNGLSSNPPDQSVNRESAKNPKSKIYTEKEIMNSRENLSNSNLEI
jgi:hypothetical protein